MGRWMDGWMEGRKSGRCLLWTSRLRCSIHPIRAVMSGVRDRDLLSQFVRLPIPTDLSFPSPLSFSLTLPPHLNESPALSHFSSLYFPLFQRSSNAVLFLKFIHSHFPPSFTPPIVLLRSAFLVVWVVSISG